MVLGRVEEWLDVEYSLLLVILSHFDYHDFWEPFTTSTTKHLVTLWDIHSCFAIGWLPTKRHCLRRALRACCLILSSRTTWPPITTLRTSHEFINGFFCYVIILQGKKRIWLLNFDKMSVFELKLLGITWILTCVVSSGSRRPELDNLWNPVEALL